MVNSWSDKKAYHLRSKDGIRNWTNEGLAFDPRSDFLRYTDGTVNRWAKIERPGVFIENGHVTHWTFAVIDSEKENDHGNDDHNSKVIVVPFDGVGFDGVIIPPHRDTVYNGKFETGKNGWTLNIWDGSATGDVINGEYRAIISSIGENNHDIQLVQAGLIIEKGKSYEVTFDAYAVTNRTLEVNVEMENDPWTSYLQTPEIINLTTTKTSYSIFFKMGQPTDSSGRLAFNFGGATGTIYLDNVKIQQTTEISHAPLVGKKLNLKPDVSYQKSSLRIRSGSDPDNRLSVYLLDLTGKVINRRDLQSCSEHTWNLKLSGLPGGIYVVGLKENGKLIKSSKILQRN